MSRKWTKFAPNERMSRRSFVIAGSHTAASLAVIGSLSALSGCGSGGGNTSGNSSLQSSTLTVKRSANGPDVTTLNVLLGNGASASPNQGGVIALSQPIGGTATTMVIVTDSSGSQPLLLAVVPAGTTISIVDERSTVLALLFLRFMGNFFPQSQHAEMITVFNGITEVEQAVAVFGSAYQSNASVLATLAQSTGIIAALQQAASAVAPVLANTTNIAQGSSMILGDRGSSKSASRKISVAPTPGNSDLISFTISNGSIQAQNSAQFFRWAGISDIQNNVLGSVILPDASYAPSGASGTTLSPATLPYQSSLNLTVTGGLNGAAKMDADHGTPLAITIALRLMMPYLYSILGVAVPTSFDPSFVVIGTTVSTGNSVLDVLVNGMGWSSNTASSAMALPAQTLLQVLMTQVGTSLDILSTLSNWLQNSYLPALSSQIPTLAAGIAGSFAGIKPFYVQSAMMATNGPVSAILKLINLPTNILPVPTTSIDLISVPYTSSFTVTQSGTIQATIE